MSERGEIKRDGAKAVKNSGRGWKEKGDARWRGFVVDYKEYEKGFRITRDNWGKICTDTMKTDLTAAPALKLIIGESPNLTRLAVIEWSELEMLLDAIEQLKERAERYWDQMLDLEKRSGYLEEQGG